MKKIFLLITFSFLSSTWSQVLLVPGRNAPLEDYLKKCSSEGYQCTQNYFKAKIKEQSSVAFEDFLEKIDLQNQDYRQNFPVLITELIKNEDLSTEQAALMIKVISKYETLEKNSLMKEVRNEIKELIIDLAQFPDERSDRELYIVFKKVLTQKQFAQIKYKIKFVRATKITPYTEPTSALSPETAYLIQESCGFSAYIQNIPLVPFAADCSSSLPNYASEFKWTEYQKPVLYTVAAAAAIFLLSQYELKIQY